MLHPSFSKLETATSCPLLRHGNASDESMRVVSCFETPICGTGKQKALLKNPWPPEEGGAAPEMHPTSRQQLFAPLGPKQALILRENPHCTAIPYRKQSGYLYLWCRNLQTSITTELSQPLRSVTHRAAFPDICNRWMFNNRHAPHHTIHGGMVSGTAQALKWRNTRNTRNTSRLFRFARLQAQHLQSRPGTKERAGCGRATLLAGS